MAKIDLQKFHTVCNKLELALLTADRDKLVELNTALKRFQQSGDMEKTGKLVADLFASCSELSINHFHKRSNPMSNETIVTGKFQERRKNPNRAAQDDVYYTALRIRRRLENPQPLTPSESAHMAKMLDAALKNYDETKL